LAFKTVVRRAMVSRLGQLGTRRLTPGVRRRGGASCARLVRNTRDLTPVQIKIVQGAGKRFAMSGLEDSARPTALGLDLLGKLLLPPGDEVAGSRTFQHDLQLTRFRPAAFLHILFRHQLVAAIDHTAHESRP